MRREGPGLEKGRGLGQKNIIRYWVGEKDRSPENQQKKLEGEERKGRSLRTLREIVELF